ncbi:hypothetical protein [Algoriphagus mannitolivorans]|uniref:hypothetical protein n=1 Tax=Algoriphagus mannitolivorans TaxID=226504 RepID=UPI000401E12C|nr:hypothetical protein [Algoriphagus mannitolivorans]
MLAFFFFLMALLFRGRKFLEGYNRSFVVLVLVVGFGGFFMRSKPKKEDIKLVYGKMETIKIKYNWTNSLFLNLVRDPETGEILQEESSSIMSGLVAGIDWHHVRISEFGDQKILEGFITWRLLGWRILDSFHYLEVPNLNPSIE